MTASAFAAYRRIQPQQTSCPPRLAREAVLRPWRAPHPSEHLAAVDLVGEQLLDAMVNVAREGAAAGVRLTGAVETPHFDLKAAAQDAARTGTADGLEECRRRVLFIRSFSVLVETDGCPPRAELRSDGVIFVYSRDPACALDAARRLARTALGVEISTEG